MRAVIIIVSLALTYGTSHAESTTTTEPPQNKTKRGLIDQTHYYSYPHVVRLVQAPVQDSSPAHSSYHTPRLKAAETDPPKQVTVQQVLYEYQQTPHNAVSNVHVNQQFQTVPLLHDPKVSETSGVSNLQVDPVAVATPVHHAAVIHHTPKLLYTPVVQTTQPPTTLHNFQPKYVYANGKIVYHPYQNANPYPGITVPARAHNLVRVAPTHVPFRPSPLVSITHQPPPVQPLPLPVQPRRLKPTEAAPVKEEVEEEEEEEEREEDEDEDNSPAEEEEEDDEPYSRYRFDFDEDDHEGFRDDDEEDEDNTRSHSRQVRKKPKNKSNRYNKSSHYKYGGRYENSKKRSSKYKSPRDYFRAESTDRKPKKSYKQKPKPKPKEVIRGLHSENTPVVNNRKVIRQEKWFVMKKSD